MLFEAGWRQKLVSGPLYDAVPIWHNSFVLTHCAWLASEVWFFPRSRGLPKSAGLPPFCILLIPASLIGSVTLSYLYPAEAIAGSINVLLWTALGLIWSGIAVRAWSLQRTKIAQLSHDPAKAGRLLVTGPFLFLENPALSGGYLTVLGVSLGFGNRLSFVLVAVVCAAAFVCMIRSDQSKPAKVRSGSDKVRWRFIPLIW